MVFSKIIIKEVVISLSFFTLRFVFKFPVTSLTIFVAVRDLLTTRTLL